MPSGFEPADRLKRLKSSGIRRFFSSTEKMPGTVNLSVGESDFCPPEYVVDASARAGGEGKMHYEPTNGILELREALAQKARKGYGLGYNPDNEVLITVGASEAIFATLFGIVNPGDEVLVPDPGFVLYEPCVRLAGGVPISVPLPEERGFRLCADDVMSLITDRSRVIILNYPNNPTGGVLTYGEVVALAKVAVERDLIVISDEVYEKLVYDGAEHHCLAVFPSMQERTLIVNSFSKTYAMTGLRVGYVYGPSELISAPWLVHEYTVTCVNSLAQYAALAALNGPQDFVKDMVREFDRRRNRVHKRLNAIGGFRCALPKGAFYAFPNIETFSMSSEQFSGSLAKDAGVITVPGSAFGSHGEGYVQISYAAAYEVLEEALDRIETRVRKLG